jgi:hypothetical protein
MTPAENARPRTIPMALAGLVAIISAVVVLALAGAPAGHASAHDHAAPAAALSTPRQVAFHDAMRKLWEDHITWTRLAIVSFAGNLPDLAPTEARLLRNQTDIGNAVKPFYGRAAGDALTRLLKAHINGAVALLVAARSGDAAKIASAKAAWYANGRQIAAFLHNANPQNWPLAEMRSLMKAHLDETLKEAVDRLSGRFQADIRDYDAVHHHILLMADVLSAGIMRQFPARFR